MARFLMLVAFCMLPAVVSAGHPFWLEGWVHCDTCQFGFETPLSTFIEGATVIVECKDSMDMQVTYEAEAVTGPDGRWEMEVDEDHHDELCTVRLFRSPLVGCRVPDPGHNSASLILTRYNGVVSNRHCANSMGFFKDTPLHGCAALRSLYQLSYEA
ncbi:protein DOWNSTREAM OF FLC-like [Punica granatum]|uniref:Uncharacterized protein n=2 Tax=Punica granatum TaxID=22663 RepID=A0A2I0JZC7_PUNGR|nr:protein DOWNSTREAM OF FLC-like [Punica granatum]PKI61200.1 hypothetical protein CRG98_018431 [Punica granatum]